MTRAARWGRGASLAVAWIGIVYVGVLGVGVARFGASRPIAGPVLATMEILTMASASAILIAVAAFTLRATDETRLFGVLAMACTTAFFGTTLGVHFIELTAGQQLGSEGFDWPSRTYAAELLAWDGFLGLALVFAALTCRNHGLERWVGRGLGASGALSLAGLVGPIVGSLELQRVGILGYGVALPVTFALMSCLFKRDGRRGLTEK